MSQTTPTTLQLREQRRIRELSASTMRALANNPNLHVRQQWFFDGNRPLIFLAPHLQTLSVEELQYLRGLADSLALRVQHSDENLHQAHMPEHRIARLIYDWLESLRAETFAPNTMPGVKENLKQRFYFWSAGFHHANHTQTELGILLYTVSQMCWSRLMDEPVYPETQDLIEPIRASLSFTLGRLMNELKENRHCQEKYIEPALQIAQLITNSIETERAKRKKEEPESEDDEEKIIDDFALLLDLDIDDNQIPDPATQSHSTVLAEHRGHYRVFTKEFDTITEAAKTIRPALLKQYRTRINHLISHQHIQFNLLVQRMRRALLMPHGKEWQWDQEEGLIDGRRLTQLVSSPNERRLFRKPLEKLINRCSISFLIDCSGSMKAHAETIALMVDILTRALERAGAQTEVLGFTTRAWNGGRAIRRWRATGRKPNPGRLNELELRIFKQANQTWRQASLDLMALLKLDQYREGIDGEAVEWACQRLLQQDSKRKILYVLSDGSPMDSATNLANDELYLTGHLMQILQQYAKLGVEIWGIGIGLDLGQLYRHSLIADLEKGLDNHFLDDFIHSLYPPKNAYLSY